MEHHFPFIQCHQWHFVAAILELQNALKLLYTEHLWWSTFAYHWMWHIRRNEDPEWIVLRRQITQWRIFRIKTLMPQLEDFFPRSEHSSWNSHFQWGWNVPHPSIRSDHLLSSPFLIRKKIAKSTLCRLFPVSNALELIRKNPQNRTQNLQNCGFWYVRIAGNTSCCMQWTCSYRNMHFGNIINTKTRGGGLDRGSHVYPISSNFFTKLRTLFTE